MSEATTSATSSQPSSARPKGGQIQVFTAADAKPLEETGMMRMAAPPPERKPLNAVFAEAAGQATTTRVLFSTPGPGGFSLVYAWLKSGFPLPRHSHDSDCVYYIIGGELTLGNKVLKGGDGFFVPADCVYAYTPGPDGVEILEFRTSSDFDFVMRSGTLPMWEHMAAICKANSENWKSETPPTRQSTGLG
ncbi:MAG: cupin domain-containing protein [Janthinobacterium lividum]